MRAVANLLQLIFCVVRLKNGAALYSNQWIETPRYKLEKKYNRPIFFRFGELKGLWGIVKAALLQPKILQLLGLSKFDVSQANTAFAVFGDRIFACHEASYPFEIIWNEDNTFDSAGYDTFGGLDYPVTAHPKVRTTGLLIFEFDAFLEWFFAADPFCNF